MTAPTLPGLEPVASTPDVALRPGSRAARMALPRSVDVLKEIAAEYGVCVRPLALRRTDLETGLTEVIDLPCGATREDKCPACAKRNRRLRQAQIREGWHRDDEPLPAPQPATEEQKALILLRGHLEFARDEASRACQWDQVEDLDDAIREVEEAIAATGLRGRVAPPRGRLGDNQVGESTGRRRKRSTKRRQDAPDLPRRKVERRHRWHTDSCGRSANVPGGVPNFSLPRTGQRNRWKTNSRRNRRAQQGRDCDGKRRTVDGSRRIGVPAGSATDAVPLAQGQVRSACGSGGSTPAVRTGGGSRVVP